MKDVRFASRLREVMREDKLTQAKLAEILVVSRQAVGGWIKGVIPHQRSLNAIEYRLGISSNWLLTGEGKPKIAGYKPNPKSTARTTAMLSALREAADESGPLFEGYENILRESEQRAAMAREKLRELSVKWHRRVKEIQRPSSDGSKKRLPSSGKPVVLPSMRVPDLDNLLKKIRRLTKESGAKKALATSIGVSQQQLSDWLSKKAYSPSGKYTLRLLSWVQAREAQPAKSPGGALTPPRRVTQLEESYEKPKARSKKASHKGKKRSIAKRRSR